MQKTERNCGRFAKETRKYGKRTLAVLENAEASLMVKTKENVVLVESVRRLRDELARTREGSQR